MRRIPNLLLVFLFSAILSCSLATPVSAHASLVQSDPSQNASIDQSPTRVYLSFSESLETQSSTLKVLSSAGSRVDNNDLTFSPDHLSMSIGIPAQPKGVYTISYQVVSAVDGHPTSGSFSFGVQTIVPPPPSTPSTLEPPLATLIPEALVRWTLFLGQTIMVGALLFQQLVLAPRLKEDGTESAGKKSVSTRCTERVLRLSLFGTVLAISGTVGLIAIHWTGQAGSMSFTQFILGTRLGVIGGARLGLVSGILLMLLQVTRTNRTKPIAIWATTAAGTALLLTASLSGHNAATSSNTALAVFSDWVHLLGVAAWIGGLFSFALITPILKGERLHQHLSKLIPRFSQLAMASVGGISITGIFSAWLQVESFPALLKTLYGSTLIVKVSLMIPIVLLGALTQLAWHPRMVKAMRSMGNLGPKFANLGGRIVRSVRTEAALGTVLLLTVGLLTALPPAVQVIHNNSQPIFQSKVLTQQADDVHITLSVFPFRIGADSFEVLLRDGQGKPTQSVTEVIFDFRFLDAPVGVATANGDPAGEGRFLLQGTYLSMPGNWRIDITVRRAGIFDSIASFETRLEAYPGLDAARVVEMPLSDPSLSVFDIQVDGSGTVWFTLPAAGSIGRFQPLLGNLEIFQSNYTGSSPNTITFDSGGKIWFTDALRHSIVAFDPASKQFREFPVVPTGGQPTGIAFDGSGTAWFTETLFSQLRGFSPENGTFTAPISTPSNSSRPGPVIVDQQQRVWFAEETTGKIGMLNSTTGTIREFSQPNALSITGVSVAPNGDIWIAEHGSSRISRYDPRTNSTTSVPLTNLLGLPWALEVDPQGNVWFVEHAGKIGFYDVGSASFQEFTIPTSDSGPRNLSLDQFGNVWFGESKGKLGVLALEPGAIGLASPAQDILYAEASVAAGTVVAVATLMFFVLHRKRTRMMNEKSGPAGSRS